MAKKPSVFISSTFYDLKQLRSDLFQYFETIGYTPNASEYNSFPVDPDTDTVEACLSAVKGHADIFILIIGGRYGYETDAGKSITNLEYEIAIRQRIPILIFIQKNIYTAYTLWKDNQEGDFSSLVDNKKIFNFIEDIYKTKKWVFQFELAQDIIECLRHQLANLFYQSLQLRKKVIVIDEELKYSLSPNAYKIYYEKKDAWEILLFFQVLEDHLASFHELKNDVEYSVSFLSGKKIKEPLLFIDWIQGKMSDIQEIISVGNHLLNDCFSRLHQKSQYELNKSMYFAKKLAEIYKRILEWVVSVREQNLEENFKQSQFLLSNCMNTNMKEFEKFPMKARSQINDALENIEKLETPVIELKMVFVMDNHEDLNKEINSMEKIYGA